MGRESISCLTSFHKHEEIPNDEFDFKFSTLDFSKHQNATSFGFEGSHTAKVASNNDRDHLYFGILTSQNCFQVFLIILKSEINNSTSTHFSSKVAEKETKSDIGDSKIRTDSPLRLPKCFLSSYTIQNILLPDVRENEVSFYAILYWYEAVRGNLTSAESVLQKINGFFDHEEQSSQEKCLVAYMLVIETILACTGSPMLNYFFTKACALAEKLLFVRYSSDKDDESDLSMKEMWYIQGICAYDAFSADSFLNGTTLLKASYIKNIKFPLQSSFSIVAIFLPLVNEIAIYGRRIDDIYEIVKYQGLLADITEELTDIEKFADNIEAIIKDRIPAEHILENSKLFSQKELDAYDYYFELFKLTLLLFLNVFVRRLRGPTLSNRLRTLKTLELLEILVFQYGWKEPSILSLFLVSLVSQTSRAKVRITRLIRNSSLNQKICRVLLSIVERKEGGAICFEYCTTLKEVLRYFPPNASFV